MKIEELIKDLDPVTIIEFKNYVIENLGELCKIKNSNSKIISNHRCDEVICKHCKEGQTYFAMFMRQRPASCCMTPLSFSCFRTQ